jgi:soluble lytic murein transglycosylase
VNILPCSRPRLGSAILCLVVCAASLQAAADDPHAAAREEFVAAYARADAGREPLQADSDMLIAYPLYPYVQAARIRAALAAERERGKTFPADADAARFIAAHAEEPVSRIVRRAWLPSLAQRHQWRAFLDVYGQVVSPDQALRCQAIAARRALGEDAGLADAVIAEWLTPRSAADTCDPAFDWLRTKGLLDESLIERRARLALAEGQSGLAKWLARSLPKKKAGPLRDWAVLIDSPQAAVDALIASPATTVEDTALLDGWTRLSRRNPDAAVDRFEALVKARGLDARRASPYARALALGLAWNRRGKALDYFARVATADFDATAWEWQARAAIWAGDWERLDHAIDAMPTALADDARWRYWAARAQEGLGHAEQARRLYAEVVPTDNWFAVLAAARLGQRFAPHPQPVTYDADAVATVERSAPFIRARELLLSDLPSLAQVEWNAGYAAAGAPTRVAAVIMASRWGWHFQSIATAAQLGHFDDYALLFPRPFDQPVAEGARLSGLPATLIYAVIRQESLYQPWAVSGAGAVGLMQLLPATARRTATLMARPRPSREALMRPQINVPLGAGFLARLVEDFDGQVVLALSSYNAGPAATSRWLPDHPMDVDAWVENIPYNETRSYVQRIMWYSVVFQWLEDGEPEDASSWLAKVKQVSP